MAFTLVCSRQIDAVTMEAEISCCQSYKTFFSLSLKTSLVQPAVNQGKSAASFCRQVAAWVTGMFSSFYLVKNNKTANNSTATKARGKISAHLEGIVKIWQSVVMLNVIILSVTCKPFMLSVIILNVVMLSVVAPTWHDTT